MPLGSFLTEESFRQAMVVVAGGSLIVNTPGSPKQVIRKRGKRCGSQGAGATWLPKTIGRNEEVGLGCRWATLGSDDSSILRG